MLTVGEGCGIIFKSKRRQGKKVSQKRNELKKQLQVLTESRKCVNMIELLGKAESKKRKFFEN